VEAPDWLAVGVATSFSRKRSNHARIALALAAAWLGLAAIPPWLAPGTFTKAVGIPRSWSAV
jgi:hypothetical protein